MRAAAGIYLHAQGMDQRAQLLIRQVARGAVPQDRDEWRNSLHQIRDLGRLFRSRLQALYACGCGIRQIGNERFVDHIRER
jgi:hypothetical protein